MIADDLALQRSARLRRASAPSADEPAAVRRTVQACQEPERSQFGFDPAAIRWMSVNSWEANMLAHWRTVGGAATLFTGLSMATYGANAQGVNFELNNMKAVGGDNCAMYYDVTNNSNIYIRHGFASTIIRDKDGIILEKGGLRFDRAKPHTTVVGEDDIYNLNCIEASSIEVILEEVEIAGDTYSREKVPQELMNGTNSSLISSVMVK